MIFEPIKKINQKFYRCDNRFYLDNVLEMYKSEIRYGIALISGKEYRCYILELTGTHRNFKLVTSDTHEMQKGHKKGGQSAPRFQRIKEEKDQGYVKKVSGIIVKSYMRNNNTTCLIDKLILAGPGEIKKEVSQQDIFKQYFSKIIDKTISTSEINDKTIYDVYDKCNSIFTTHDVKFGDKVMSEIENLMSDDIDKIIFGEVEIGKCVMANNISKIIISSDYNQKKKEQLKLVMPTSCKLYEISKDKLKEYGNILGIKRFSYNESTEYETDDITHEIDEHKDQDHNYDVDDFFM
jgi:peptide chain release factor subunit 1